MKIFLNSLTLCLLLQGSANPAFSESVAGKDVITLRIMTVVICQQGGFLQYLLEPYLAGKKLRVEYSQGHHREVAAAVKRGEVDIAITHTKVKTMQELAATGRLINGRTIFANPKAFLGPRGDPASIGELQDGAMAMQRIQERGFCYVINPHGEMENLQEQLLAAGTATRHCVINDVNNVKEALHTAFEQGGYTMWGLHPYLEKGDGKLEPIVIPDPRLQQNLAAWVVQGSGVEKEARELVYYLAGDDAKAAYLKFRFPGYDGIQPWWSPKESQ
ncbi:MAG: hypothetical protein ACRESK_07570 [Gammaproteobacteria bacterium]